MATTATIRPGPGRKALEQALAQLDTVVGKVGWFSSSIYPDGTPVAYIASIQEYGYAPHNLPPRLGMRITVAEKQKEWSGAVAYGAKQVFKGAWTAVDMMEFVGTKAERDIFKHISNVTEPPLAESTLRARAARLHVSHLTSTGAKPLNDTGYMIATLTHIVSQNKGDGE